MGIEPPTKRTNKSYDLKVYMTYMLIRMLILPGSGTEVTKPRKFFDLYPEPGKKLKNPEIFTEILFFQKNFKKK